ncbi:glycosyltransferase [candidate division WOR-3 bacterium]|nr:glycosyltransferase [candidate division WOR-3 bacterium]
MIIAARIVFWCSIGLMLYILFGHGVLLTILRVFFTKPINRKPITPSVCFIIPAYNEEKCISDKLENTLELDYPENKLMIVVVSDASTDDTDRIVKALADKNRRIVLLRMAVRGGRTNGIEEAMRRYKADAYAVSDANVMLDKKALREAVTNFADPHVGAVTVRFIGLGGKGNPTEKGIGGYWGYEQKFRWMESQICSLSFISGSFNVVRAGLLDRAPANVTHDHFIPANLVQKGYRSVYEPKSIVYEYPAETSWEEAMIRGRNFLMGVNFMSVLPGTLKVREHPWFFFNLLIRKILRWFFPVFMLLSLVGATFLIQEIIPSLYLILVGIGLSLTGLMVILKNPPRLLSTIGFFFLSQIGLMWGIIQFIFGKRIIYWEPPR